MRTIAPQGAGSTGIVFTAHFRPLPPNLVCYAMPYIQLLCVASTAFCLVMVAVDLYLMVVRATGPAQLHGGLYVSLELSVGPFCVTRSNTAHQLTDPIQPNPLQRENLDPTRHNPTQLLSVNLLSAVFSDQNFSTIAIVDTTLSNPPKIETSRPNPTQPVGQPNRRTTLCQSQIRLYRGLSVTYQPSFMVVSVSTTDHQQFQDSL